MIKVLVVDESPIVCRLLSSYLQIADDIEVVGVASDGMACLSKIQALQPDVVTLGLALPKMDGLETLGHIMHDMPTPVVVITGASRRAARLSLAALNAGAVDFILKYSSQANMPPSSLRQEIVDKVRAAAKVRVVRSVRKRLVQFDGADPITAKVVRPIVAQRSSTKSDADAAPAGWPNQVIVVGASTGGPVAVRELLEQLPSQFPASILVVQHMPATFTGVLAAQLDQQISLPVREAQSGDELRAGQVLVVPGDYHLLVEEDVAVVLNQAPKIMGHRPSIDVTMQSVAQVFGRRTHGIVLTGMGEDGTMGLMAIQAKGGKTYTQDSDSCVVDGMPQRARERNVGGFVGTPLAIGQKLREVMQAEADFQVSIVNP
ncbi:MAG: chemotaxis-specific protein-glutamate methyltransferase CheB [Chloroflexota bacterium]